MLQTAVLSFGVFSDCYEVHVFVGSVHALDGLAGTDVGEEIQSFSEGNVERSEAFSNWRFERAFQAVLVALDCLDAFVSNQVAMLCLTFRMNLMRFELNRHLQGMEDVLHTPRDLRADSISRKQHNSLLLTVAQPCDQSKRPHS